MNGLQVMDERSLRLHGAVAEKLKRNPEVLERARARVDAAGRPRAPPIHATRSLGDAFSPRFPRRFLGILSILEK